MGFLRNGSGYVDPTAYKALSKIEKENQKMNMKFLKGDVVFVNRINPSVNEERDGKMMLLVSERFCSNEKDYFLAVSLLKKTWDMFDQNDYHCEVMTRIPSIALCERVSYIPAERIGDFVRSCTESEMANVEKCLAAVLELKTGTAEGSENIALKHAQDRIVELEAHCQNLKEENELVLSAKSDLQNEMKALIEENEILKKKLNGAVPVDEKVKTITEELERYKKLVDVLLKQMG